MVPLITREFTFSYFVSELVLDVNMFDTGFGVPKDSVKQPIQRNSVSLGHVFHSETPTLFDHFDHCLIVFIHVQLSFDLGRTCFCGNVIHIWQFIHVSITVLFDLVFGASDFTACSTYRHLIFNLFFSKMICLMDAQNAILLLLHLIDREKEYHPFENQHLLK